MDEFILMAWKSYGLKKFIGSSKKSQVPDELAGFFVCEGL